MCTCGCGLSAEVAHDPTQAFKVDTFICRAGRAIAKVRRAAEDKHKDDEGWGDALFFYAEPVDDTPPPQRVRPTQRSEEA
jgi:hypothetical protein